MYLSSYGNWTRGYIRLPQIVAFLLMKLQRLLDSKEQK